MSPEKHHPGFQWDSRQGSRWDPTLRQRIEVQIAFKQKKRGEKNMGFQVSVCRSFLFSRWKTMFVFKKLAQLLGKGVEKIIEIIEF